MQVVNSTMGSYPSGSTSSLLGIGVAGMQQSLGRIDTAASNIARAGISDSSGEGGVNTGMSNVDLASNMVDMKFNQHVFDASANVVKTADEMIGTVLDMFA